MTRLHVASHADLRASGLTRRQIDAAVVNGELVRARRDRYLPSAAPRSVVQAVRIGGRVTCLSLLQELGVFVFENRTIHVHVTRGSSRLRSATDPKKPLGARSRREEVVHWLPLVRPEDATRVAVSVVDALIHATLCQKPTHAVATLDSTLDRKLVSASDLADVFSALPARYAVLRGMVDGRAQAGTETIVRLMARRLGCRVEPQAHIDGAGFVDLLVDGWLAVECDSKQFHSTWSQQLKDFDRNLVLARGGVVTLRLTAADILYRPDEVFAALRALVLSRR